MVEGFGGQNVTFRDRIGSPGAKGSESGYHDNFMSPSRSRG